MLESPAWGRVKSRGQNRAKSEARSGGRVGSAKSRGQNRAKSGAGSGGRVGSAKLRGQSKAKSGQGRKAKSVVKEKRREVKLRGNVG